MNRLLLILFFFGVGGLASAQSGYRKINEAVADSIIQMPQKKSHTKDYKQVELEKFRLQGEHVMFSAKWTGDYSKYRCALPLYASNSAIVYTCKKKKNSKRPWDEENHIDFSGITLVVNGTKHFIPLSHLFTQFDYLNQYSGTSQDLIVNGIVVTKVNGYSIDPTFIIENVKILK